jgi:hypothetical protein
VARSCIDPAEGSTRSWNTRKHDMADAELSGVYGASRIARTSGSRRTVRDSVDDRDIEGLATVHGRCDDALARRGHERARSRGHRRMFHGRFRAARPFAALHARQIVTFDDRDPDSAQGLISRTPRSADRQGDGCRDPYEDGYRRDARKWRFASGCSSSSTTCGDEYARTRRSHAYARYADCDRDGRRYAAGRNYKDAERARPDAAQGKDV